jgi:hypothetical protein
MYASKPSRRITQRQQDRAAIGRGADLKAPARIRYSRRQLAATTFVLHCSEPVGKRGRLG